MKVCVLSGSSFEKNYSSYHLMRDLIEAILNDGHEVRLIQKCYGKPDCLPSELKCKQGITVKSIPFQEAEKSNLIKRMFADMVYYFKASKAVKKYKDSDVFFLQSNNVPWLPVFLIRFLTHKPVVYNVQDIFPQNAIYAGILDARSLPSKVFLKLQKYALDYSDSIITISEDMKETLVAAGAKEEKVSVIYNWKNGSKDANEQINKTEDGKFHVVYAGSIGRMQNVEVIIRAAAELKNYPEFQFDIYGDGVLKDQCIAVASELKATNVRFLEPVPSEKAHALYENADLNIIPLGAHIIKTALPSKTAICLSCGKPCIFCIDRDSKFALLLQKYGIKTVAPASYKDLAEQIKISCGGSEQDKDIGNLLQLLNQNYSLTCYKKILEKIQGTYKEKKA